MRVLKAIPIALWVLIAVVMVVDPTYTPERWFTIVGFLLLAFFMALNLAEEIVKERYEKAVRRLQDDSGVIRYDTALRLALTALITAAVVFAVVLFGEFL